MNNYVPFKNLETHEIFEGLDVLGEFDTQDIISWVNSGTMDDYKTHEEFMYDLTDEVLLQEMEIRDINLFKYSDFDIMLKELVNEVPVEHRTVHFNVMLDRIERDFNNGSCV